MLNIEEVKEELVGKSINFKGENFIITDIDESILKTHVNNEIKADIKVILSDGRGIALFSALGASKATVDADTYEYLKIIAPEIWELTEQAKLEEQARILAEQQEREEKEKAEAIKKAEAKYEKHVQATLNRYNAWKALRLDEDLVRWFKENVRSIKASIPDFLEDVFMRDFPGAPYRLVDTKTKRTSGGYLIQWDMGMKVNLKKDAEIPSELQDMVKGHTINSNTLARTLVWDYGFNFS